MFLHAPGVRMHTVSEDAVHEEIGDEDGEDPERRFLLCIRQVDSMRWSIL